MSNSNKNAQEFVPDRDESKTINDAIEEVNKKYALIHTAEDEAAKYKIEIGEYLLKTFFEGKPDNYEDDKYNPRKLNSYRTMAGAKDLKVARMTLQNYIRSAMLVIRMESKKIPIRKLFTEEVEVKNSKTDEMEKRKKLFFTHIVLLTHLGSKCDDDQVRLVKAVASGELAWTRDLDNEVRDINAERKRNAPGYKPPEPFAAALNKLFNMGKTVKYDNDGNPVKEWNEVLLGKDFVEDFEKYQKFDPNRPEADEENKKLNLNASRLTVMRGDIDAAVKHLQKVMDSLRTAQKELKKKEPNPTMAETAKAA